MSHRTVMPYSETPPKPVSVRSSSGQKSVFASRIELRSARLGARQLLGQRLDLQAVDRDDAEALVQEMVREGVAGRPEPDDEDVLAVVGERVRTRRVERVPARQERPDLESPWHREDVRENARLRLRNVDGILRLEDAGLHAVVADAVPGAGDHRIVDADERESRERVPLAPEHVHLRDLLVQRAARERHAERIRADTAVLLPKALRARVLVALVAEDAVMRLAGDLARGLARIGEREAVARASVRRQAEARLGKVRPRAFRRDERVEFHRPRNHEGRPRLRPAAVRRAEAQRRHVRVEGVGPFLHEHGVVRGTRKTGPVRPGAQIRESRARGLGRVGRVARARGRERTGEVEEVPPRVGDAPLLVRGVEAGGDDVDERSSGRRGGVEVERGDRGGVGVPLRGALLEDGEAKPE